jgi:putative Mg2+ transporter-C (MgtC) family protein
MTGLEEIVLRLFLGALLGGVIGYERYTHGRPAGLRTHLIVCLASVLIMIVSVDFQYLTKQNPAYIRIDPSRIAAGAITGIGFLGAGVIIKSGLTIQGLTTAACLWIVSAVGLAVGCGIYLPGIITTIITVGALWLLRLTEKKMGKVSYKFVDITANSAVREKEIEEVFKGAKVAVHNIDYGYDRESNIFNYLITVSVDVHNDIRNVLDRLSHLNGISKISIKS